MEPLLESLALARDGFARRVRAVEPGGWDGPTPCSEWNVRLLVNHVVGQDVRGRRLLEGATMAEFLATRDDDVIGSDPVGAWDRAAHALDCVLAAPGALERFVEYRTGPATPVRELSRVRIFDLTVHTWDLARAIGADEALHPDLVAAALATWADLAAAGVVDNPALFAPAGTHAVEDVPPQQRLLQVCGRRAFRRAT